MLPGARGAVIASWQRGPSLTDGGDSLLKLGGSEQEVLKSSWERSPKLGFVGPEGSNESAGGG